MTRRDRQYYVYILTNRSRSVLYTGVTGDLKRRVRQHKETVESFTSRYNADELVYYEPYGQALDAIARETHIKAGSRKKKMDLIDGSNPNWRDLYPEL